MRLSWREFLRDKAGNFALSTALIAVPLIGGIGVSIDFVSAYNRHIDIQMAADSAVLAAASSRKTDEAQLKAIAEKTLKSQLATVNADANIVSLSVDDKKYVTLKVESVVPVTLAAVFRPDGIRVEAMTQAVIGSDDDVEIAMVLDNTYSMVGQKLVDLKLASNTLLTLFETQMKTSPDPSKVRFAIVPFARYVNVGLANRNQAWLSVPADSSTSKNVCSTTKPLISKSGCTTTTSTAYNDGVPYTKKTETCKSYVYGDPVTTCKTQVSTTKWSGCVGSRGYPFDTKDIDAKGKKYTGIMNTTCGSQITQLTSNYATLRAQINAMVANNETYIQPGVVWGLNMLNPEAPFEDAKPYSDDVKKFMIVMTDGENTISPTYPTHNGTDKKKADALLAETCANVKAKGITIFTVAVGIQNSDTEKKLSACATDLNKAISVKDTSALTAAFSDIARQILAVRLTR